MRPSANHNNRKRYNWLIYNIGDKFLLKFSRNYKGKLYDLGCSDASFKPFFLKYIDEYIGVDWSGSQHKTQTDITADLNDFLPIESEVADVVVSISVMEHLFEPKVFLSESYRILKKGGFLLLQVPWQWHIHEAPHDFYRYSPFALRKMLENAGFDEISIEASSGFFTTVMIKFNYFSRRLISGPIIFKYLIKLILYPIWFLNQVIAPELDRLDKDWKEEAQGFYITAIKKK